MTSRIGLHKLADVMFGMTQNLALNNQNCPGDRSLKKEFF